MSGDKTPLGARPISDTTHDAVVIVPGIMGSRLVERATGDVLWGLAPSVFANAWLSGAKLRALHLTDDEQCGRYGRVQADQLLRTPAWFPFLRGVEPYTDLINAIRTVVADPAAMLEFPYDWRLPAAHNASLLAESAMKHLTTWRTTQAHETARRRHPTGRPAQLVLIAHSMGGLLTQYLAKVSGVNDEVRANITLGTPFHGSIKATIILNHGRGTQPPMPADRIRDLATTLPGIYDLLPWYSCVDAGITARQLATADVVDIGGDPDLTAAAWTAHTQRADATLPGHRLVIGTAQQTPQSLHIRDGVAEPLDYECRVQNGTLLHIDRKGDGTVPRGSAELRGSLPTYRAQQHASLARSSEVIREILDVLTERDTDLLGPPMSADDGYGLDVPDTEVRAGEQWHAKVTGVTQPRDADCFIIDTSSRRKIGTAPLERRDNALVAVICIPNRGLYRIELAGHGFPPISQLVLAAR